MRIGRKLGGMVLLSLGVGIMLGLLIPGIGLLIACVFIIAGFTYVFM